MNRRFFSERPIRGDSIELIGPEAHHILKVLRASVGDSMTLFDGSGSEFTGKVSSISRGAVELAIVGRQQVSREASRRLILGVALPKGDRQRMLVEKCVELGVAQLVPLKTARGVAVPKPSALERLHRGVIEASKQCGRNVLMQIDAPQSLESFITDSGTDAVRWLAHPYSAPPEFKGSVRPTRETARSEAKVVYAAIGPEGGFDEKEVTTALKHGWQRVSLGISVLRVETAALALAAYWLTDPTSA